MISKFFYFSLGILLGVSLGAYGDGEAQLGRQTAELFRAKCFNCHGNASRGYKGGLNLTELQSLKTKGLLNFLSPERSVLVERIQPGGGMPESGEPLTAGEIDLVIRWVRAGAPDSEGQLLHSQNTDSVAPIEIEKNNTEESRPHELDLVFLILEDIKRLSRAELLDSRYLTFHPYYYARTSNEDLDTYRNGLLKLINSLTWNRNPVRLKAVDRQKTVYRVRLSELGWSTGKWNQLANRNPYHIEFNHPLAEFLYSMIPDTRRPYIRADWFAFTVSRPPFYYSLLDLPQNSSQLEALVKLNPRGSLNSGLVARAAIRNSGISRNYRVIERHPIEYGAFWRSYDFDANTGNRNIFNHPLPKSDQAANAFEHAGGEIIFNLPNGLQAYWLEKADGARLDVAPTEIVSDRSQPDGRIINGVSCMSCHNQGLHIRYDELLELVENTPNRFSKNELDLIHFTYRKKEALEPLFKSDIERFNSALKRIGVVEKPERESIRALADRFEAKVDLRAAASELGISVQALELVTRRDTKVAQVVFQLKSGGIPRDAFNDEFSILAQKILFESANLGIGLPRYFTRTRSAQRTSTPLNIQGTVLFTNDVPGNNFKESDPTLLGDGQTLVVGSKQGVNHQIRWFNNGRQIAAVRLQQSHASIYAPGLLADGETVVVTTDKGRIYWLKNGQILKDLSYGIATDSSPAVLADGQTVVVAVKGAVIWARDGVEIARFTVNNKEFKACSPSVLGDGKTVVVSSNDGTIYWLELGRLLKKLELGNIGDGQHVISAPAVLGDGQTVVIAEHTQVFFIKESGVISKFSREGNTSEYGSPVVLGDGETVVVPSGSKILWMHKTTGITHRTNIDAATTGTPAVLGDGTTVVVYNERGKIFWLRDGTILKTVSESATDLKSSPLILGDGKTVFIAGLGDGSQLKWFH